MCLQYFFLKSFNRILFVSRLSNKTCPRSKMTLQCTIQSMYVPEFHFRLQSALELSEQHGHHEFRDSDHHKWSEDFQKDEKYYREWHNAKKDKALSYCISLLNEINNPDQNPNTTDPLLAHEL